jgi:uncharacterized protein (TIGR02246 family)
MTTSTMSRTAEMEIRARIDDWAAANRAKDVERIMASYAPDVRSFDCHSALQFEGALALRQHLEACFPHMQGPLTFEIHDLEIMTGCELAFAHYLARCGATGLDGTEHGGWLRATACFRRQPDGRWLIVHDHCSAPFDPKSGQTMFGLEPEPQRAAAG